MNGSLLLLCALLLPATALGFDASAPRVPLADAMEFLDELPLDEAALVADQVGLAPPVASKRPREEVHAARPDRRTLCSLSRAHHLLQPIVADD